MLFTKKDASYPRHAQDHFCVFFFYSCPLVETLVILSPGHLGNLLLPVRKRRVADVSICALIFFAS